MMKEAFDNYFKKLNRVWNELMNSGPMVSYSKDINKDLIISSPDEDGDVEWKPVLQQSYDFSSITKALGFDLCDELKAFYNTYYFFTLGGELDGKSLYFDSVGAKEPLETTIINAYENGQYYYPNSQSFVIGMACINENDNYILFFDNEDGKLFCYENETNSKVQVSYSLEETISLMEAYI